MKKFIQPLKNYARTCSTQDFIWMGIVLGITYWLLEAWIHIAFFNDSNFVDEVFTTDPHEIWKRILILTLFALFTIYVQYSINIQRRTEANLCERERELSLMMENNPAGIILVDCESRKVSMANSNALKMLSSPKKDVEGHICHQFLCPAEVGQCPVMDSGQTIDISERTMLTSSGESIPILKSVTQVKYNGRDHLLETFFDLTERKKMEKDLELAYVEMEQIFQTASTAMRLISNDFRVLKVNRTFERLTGIDKNTAVRKKCYEVFEGELCFTPDCPVTLINEGHETIEYFVKKKRSDGTCIPCILNATPFMGPDNNIIGIVESFLDMTESEKSKKLIRTKHDKLNAILSHLVEGVCIISKDYSIEYKNDILNQYFGSCEKTTCYKAFHQQDHPCEPCIMKKVIRKGKTEHIEFENRNGHSFEQTYTRITDVDQIDKVVVVTRDVTEEKDALRVIMQTEQLAALGELSAGVAHEVNNPINGIINYAQILLNKSEEGSIVYDIAGRVAKEGNRIARIIEGLLSFARRRDDDNKLLSLHDALSNSLMLTAAQLRKDRIIIKKDLKEKLPWIVAQAQEVEQVFVNIISNARHALNDKYHEQDDNKILTISSDILFDNNTSYLRISFYDQGIGIPADIIDKVRNPFFSTKSNQKRTGLGLSISHGIVDKLGGKIEIESVQNEFTRVNIDFPTFLLEKDED